VFASRHGAYAGPQQAWEAQQQRGARGWRTMPTFAPGWNCVPRCFTMMLPGMTRCPPYIFTPRCLGSGCPPRLVDEPPDFFDALRARRAHDRIKNSLHFFSVCHQLKAGSAHACAKTSRQKAVCIAPARPSTSPVGARHHSGGAAETTHELRFKQPLPTLRQRLSQSAPALLQACVAALQGQQLLCSRAQ